MRAILKIKKADSIAQSGNRQLQKFVCLGIWALFKERATQQTRRLLPGLQRLSIIHIELVWLAICSARIISGDLDLEERVRGALRAVEDIVLNLGEEEAGDFCAIVNDEVFFMFAGVAQD